MRLLRQFRRAATELASYGELSQDDSEIFLKDVLELSNQSFVNNNQVSPEVNRVSAKAVREHLEILYFYQLLIV